MLIFLDELCFYELETCKNLLPLGYLWFVTLTFELSLRHLDAHLINYLCLSFVFLSAVAFLVREKGSLL